MVSIKLYDKSFEILKFKQTKHLNKKKITEKENFLQRIIKTLIWIDKKYVDKPIFMW